MPVNSPRQIEWPKQLRRQPEWPGAEKCHARSFRRVEVLTTVSHVFDDVSSVVYERVYRKGVLLENASHLIRNAQPRCAARIDKNQRVSQPQQAKEQELDTPRAKVVS